MSDEQNTAIATVDEGMTLEVYGGRPEIREMADRLLVMLPQVKQLGKAGAMALAQVSLAMGLNPFIGEIWAIPQDKNGKTFAIMPGIKGLRRKAREWCEGHASRYHVFLRTPSVDEIEGYTLNTGDIARACDLTVIDSFALELLKATGQQLVYTGIGIYKNGERTKMNPLQVARKRAEADAIKQAFDVPAPVLSSGVAISGPVIDEYGILDEMPAMPEVYLENENAPDAIGDVYGDDAAEDYADSGAPKETEAEQPDNDKKGFYLSELAMKALLDKNLAEHPANAANMVNLSDILDKDSTTAEIISWASVYRAARDDGAGKAEAAKLADNQIALEAQHAEEM